MKFLPEILLGILIIIQCITTPSLLKRAGLKSPIPGFIPVLHYIPLLKLIGRPWWWFFLLLVPGVNLIMLVIIQVEVGIVFGKRSFAEQWLFGALPWYAFYDLGFKNKTAPYVGPRDWSKTKKTFAREWGEAILFAVVAASIIRTFVLEAFTIPTPSMESSMKVGDYLFVSKLTYGPKLPQTPVSLPFVHNALPGGLTNSYLTWFSLPPMRLPGYGKVDRFDPVVFNFPNGDTVILDPFYVGHDYYNILRQEAIECASSYENYLTNPAKFEQMARDNFNKKNVCKSCGRGNLKIQGTRWRPLDKKEMYIKRCIGLPGDEIKVIDSQVYINGSAIENKPGMMWDYEVTYTNQGNLKNYIQKNFDKLNGDISLHPTKPNTLIMPLTRDEANQLSGLQGTVSFITQMMDTTSLDDIPLSIYPNSSEAPYNTWTPDEWGPMIIPAKGMTIDMNHDNYIRYKRVIGAYEGNSIYESNGQVYINGAVASNYTFKDNYYFMMGDNRSHSADSRFWGFVPETHVVGKAVFTWFSKENMEYHNDTKVRWNRMFRFVN